MHRLQDIDESFACPRAPITVKKMDTENTKNERRNLSWRLTIQFWCEERNSSNMEKKPWATPDIYRWFQRTCVRKITLVHQTSFWSTAVAPGTRRSAFGGDSSTSGIHHSWEVAPALLVLLCRSDFLDDVSTTSEASVEVSTTQMEIESSLELDTKDPEISTPTQCSQEDQDFNLSSSFTEIALSPVCPPKSSSLKHRNAALDDSCEFLDL